jgi:DNA-binding IclR family transcriptional regulator
MVKGVDKRILKTPSVPALERGMVILETIAQSRSGLTFSSLVRRLSFPKSSIHCLVLTLERMGYLHRTEDTGRYMCGGRFAQVANLVIEGAALREKAMPVLRGLVEDTGMTVHLAVLEHHDAVLIAKVAALGAEQIATWLGKRLDLHCTSLGKCLIAYLSEQEMEAMVKARGLLRHNENTIVSLRKLKEELARTRNRGYAVDDQEEELGTRCLGAPVFDSRGGVAAAVSLTGSTEQIEPGNDEKLAAMVQHAASEISRRLGWSQK